MNRTQQLQLWVETQTQSPGIQLDPASADASFRRYFRVHTAKCSLIVMDAPPPQEDCRPFVRVAGLFSEALVHVPNVVAQDLDSGFLLLSDLGTRTYLNELNEHTADALYMDAIEALVRIQVNSRAGILPPYDRTLLARELALFPDWYLTRHLGLDLNAAQREVLEQTFGRIMDRNLGEGMVFVHRDFHSRNLMISDPNPGILDFQDAVYGPISYDLVSLLKDAYISWEEERVLDWCVKYWERARKAALPVPSDFGEFYKNFEWMGVQRHIKVLGIFARLWHRDGKSGYLNDMPLVMSYLRKTCSRYNELGKFSRMLDDLEGSRSTTGLTF